MITIPSYSQYDPVWASKTLGASGLTMRTHGCYVTSVAMILNNYGYSVTPGQLCDGINSVNGFMPSGDLKWEAIGKLFPNAVFDLSVSGWTTNFKKALNIVKIQQATALERLSNLIRYGFPTILCVDNVGNDGWPDHAVVLFNAPENGAWQIKDPNGGLVINLSEGQKYGPKESAIYGLRTIYGPAMSLPDASDDRDQRISLGVWKASMVKAGRFVQTYSQEIVDAFIA